MKTIREIINERSLDRSTVLKAAQRGVFGDAARKSGATWLIDDTSPAFVQWLASRKRKTKASMDEEQAPQAMYDWLDEIRTTGIAPTDAPKAPLYFVTGYRADGTSKKFRSEGASGAEEDALRLWNTGRWVKIAINDEVRYPLEHQE